MDNMKEVRLKRQLGLLHGISIAAGLLIGAGIFITPQGVILHAGSAGLSLVLWAVGGAVAILGALTYAEIGIVIPQSGSLYACMRVMYGRFAGFIYLWSYLFFVRAGFDTIKCLLFGRYVLKPLFPDCVIPDVGVKLVATAIACFLAVINCFDVKSSARGQLTMTFTSISTLIIISVSSLIWSITEGTNNVNNAFEGSSFSVDDWILGLLMTLYSLNGWYSLNFLVEELKNPLRNLPLAIILSVSAVTVLFLVVNVSYFVVLGIDGVLQSEAVAMSVAAKTIGPVAWTIPIFIAVTASSSFNSGLMIGSRLSFAGARNGDLPTVLALINVKFLTPIISLVSQAILVIVFIWTVEVFVVIKNVVFVNLVFDAFVAVGFIRWRLREHKLQSTAANQRFFKLPLVVPVLFFLIIMVVVAVPLITKPKDSAIGLAMMLSTGVVYYLFVIKWTGKPAVLVNNMALFTRFIQKLFYCLPQDNPQSFSVKQEISVN